MKSIPIKTRIRESYIPGIGYHELMRAVFPEDEYPNAWRYSNNGGPPGCAMAFGRALREMRAWVGPDNEGRQVYLP